MSFLHQVPALRHKNFRLYFFGQAVSVIGSWIQTVAISWTIFQLSHSASLLGIAAFLIQGPQLVLTPLAGVWIDRQNRKRMFITVQTLNLVLASLLGILAWRGALLPVHLLGASAILGILNSFDAPLRQSLLSQLIEEKVDLTSAIALNASIFTTGRFIGPPIAGIMLGALPVAACFFVNAASFLAPLLALGSIRIVQPQGQGNAHASLLQSLKEGMVHAKESPAIRIPLTLLAGVNLTASSVLVLAPVFVGDIFHGKTQTLGWLLGAAGAGAVLGTVVLSGSRSMHHMVTLLLRAPVLCLTGLLTLALSPRWEVAMPAMFLLGAGIAMTNVCTNSLLQNATADRLRGRVISLFAAIRFGMDALGGFFAGLLSAAFGAVFAVSIEMMVLLLIYFVFLSKIRRLRDSFV